MTHSAKDLWRAEGLFQVALTYLTLMGIVGAGFLLMQLAVEIQLLAGVHSTLP
jgi:hypothetical protein